MVPTKLLPPAGKRKLPPNAGKGRVKGVPNKATAKAHEAIAAFVDANAERLQEWLDQIARESPKDAFNAFLALVEYHVPKMARVEHTGKDGEAIQSRVTVEFIARSNPEAFRFLWDELADDGRPVRNRAARGGRGSAKTHSFARALILKAADRQLRIANYREIQKSIRDSVKRVLDDQIGEMGLRDFYQSTDAEIRGANGSLLIFNGLRTNPDAVKSTEGLDIAVVWEANRVSQRSLDLLIPTVRKPGSELWFEWNPEFETDPVETMFCGPDGPPPGSIVRTVNCDQNPFFPDVLRQEMEWDRKRDPEKYAHIWMGGYQKHSEARVFKNWVVEDFERPAGTIFRLGSDWGFSIDPSVLLRCSIDGNRLYVDWEAYQIGCEIVNLPDLFMSIPQAEKWPITADSARPETISYMRSHGFPKMQAAVKGPGSLEEGVAFLQSFDIVVHPRCTHVIDELTSYKYRTDPLTNKVLPVLEDKNNHCIDALRYACEGARRARKVAPVAAPTKPAVEFAGPHSWMT
jgi:phage terminase large subunit